MCIHELDQLKSLSWITKATTLSFPIYFCISTSVLGSEGRLPTKTDLHLVSYSWELLSTKVWPHLVTLFWSGHKICASHSPDILAILLQMPSYPLTSNLQGKDMFLVKKTNLLETALLLVILIEFFNKTVYFCSVTQFKLQHVRSDSG